MIESLSLLCLRIVLTDYTEIADIAILPETGARTHHAPALCGLGQRHDLPFQLLLELSDHHFQNILRVVT